MKPRIAFPWTLITDMPHEGYTRIGLNTMGKSITIVWRRNWTIKNAIAFYTYWDLELYTWSTSLHPLESAKALADKQLEKAGWYLL